MEGIKTKFLGLCNEIPIFETVILLILTIITVFRKELSSNRDYRKQKSSQLDWKPMTQMTSQMKEKLFNLMEQDFTTETDENQSIVPANNSFQSINRDLLIFLLGYLTNLEICRLSCVDKRLATILHSDLAWQQIWVQRYEGLWRNNLIRSMLCRRNIHWDPFDNWGPPSQGWKSFIFEFEYAWLDWILAGANCSSLCLLGLNGGQLSLLFPSLTNLLGVYNITPFVYEHPGSPETLLDHSGRDGTITFNEIGHSLLALTLKDSYLVYQPTYISNYFKMIIFQMKKKSQLEYQKNPIQTLKSQHANVLSSSSSFPFSTRRTISVDVDDCEQKLIILPQTIFEQKLNVEREFIHNLAETHYREINYHQEIPLFQLSKDDVLQDHLAKTDTGAGTNLSAGEGDDGTHVKCHENAKLNQQQLHGPGGENLFTNFWSNNSPKHPGCPREFYDPLSQEWWIWWSCCGCGRSVPRELMT